MDIDYADEHSRTCFKVPHKIYGNLNIRHCKTSALTVLWNVYQIFVYDDLIFKSPKVFIPEFNISNVIVSNNHLICLDNNGNIHLNLLTFKPSAQKRLKTAFQPREQGIICLDNYHENTICFKYVSNIFYLCVYKISTDFILDTEHKIVYDDIVSLSNQKARDFIFHTYSITSSQYDQIKDYYQQKETWRNHVIIVFSLDRKNVFSILYSSKTGREHLLPIKLYTSPSEIADTHVLLTTNIDVILSLTIGTLIKIPLNQLKNNIKVSHLNTVIYKLFATVDYVIYTDGSTLWKAEEIFSETIKLQKCSIEQVKDFVIVSDKLLCTTFSNLIYLLPIDNKLFEELPVVEYCPANQVLSNNDCLAKIMSEVTRSNEIAKKVKDEEKYLTILSLSNRCDILDDVIQYNVSVFEFFDDVPKENLTLVESIQNYHVKDTLCFLININLKSLVNKFTDLLSSMFGDLMLHVNISSATNCIKTSSINIQGQLKKLNLAMPVFTKKYNNLNRISIELKLITSIPEVYNTTQNMWIILHSKRFNFNSEHLINMKAPANQMYSTVYEELVDPIYQSVVCHFGHMYQFSRNTRKNTEWLLYTKLTDNLHEDFNKLTFLCTHFSARKADVLWKQITSDEFLKSKSEVTFEIGNDKVILEIVNDGFTKPILKVRSTNIEKAYYIRNFLSQLINNNFTEFEAGKAFVDHGLYTAIEEFQKIINRPCSIPEFMNKLEDYQKIIVGKLPI